MTSSIAARVIALRHMHSSTPDAAQPARRRAPWRSMYRPMSSAACQSPAQRASASRGGEVGARVANWWSRRACGRVTSAPSCLSVQSQQDHIADTLSYGSDYVLPLQQGTPQTPQADFSTVLTSVRFFPTTSPRGSPSRRSCCARATATTAALDDGADARCDGGLQETVTVRHHQGERDCAIAEQELRSSGRRSTKGKEVTRSLPFPRYSALGGLRQGPSLCRRICGRLSKQVMSADAQLRADRDGSGHVRRMRRAPCSM